MDEDPSALPQGTVLAGKFRIVRCMGVGGMGAVYEIEHELTKHRRALKLLHPVMAQNAGVVERFLREASAAGRVDNPHIVESFDAGTLDTGEPYLVMEMLRGETLSSRIERGPMSVGDVVDLVGQASDGIQSAHDAGIVHRDLKPDNLFVVDADGRPFVKILDFGISKFDPGKIDGRALTQEGAALGTPYYMSPEQIRGETTIDARTDIYALGVILYECFAGFRPYDAETLTHLAIMIHTGQPKSLQEIRPDLPPGVVAVVMNAMASDRARRTGTAQQLREELERFGSISFRGRAGPGSVAMSSVFAAPSTVAAPPTVAAQSMTPAPGLGTSAAGVSVSGARQQAKQKSQTTQIATGFAVLGVAAVGGMLLFRGRAAPTAEPDAAGSVSAAPTPPAIVPVAAPVPVTAPPPPASVEAPLPSATSLSKTATTARAPFPVVAPTLQQAAPPPQAAPAAAPGGPAAPPPERKRRTEEKGLAKDNPFR